MIEPERIDQIVTIVERAGLNPETLSALRETFSGLHLTHCMDDDIGDGAPAPARDGKSFRVYLVDGSAHCMRFTSDPEQATGLVLAERDVDAED
jgi:hypothetical protein